MAISTEDQTKLLKVVAGLFNAAPGATFLPQLETFIDNGGTQKNLARELAATSQFTETLGGATTPAEIAVILADNFGLTADNVDGSPATLAITFFTNGIAEGTNIGDLVWEAVLFLSDENLAPEFAPTALLLDNKAAVSADYSAAKASTSVTDLQAALSGVTGDAPLTQAEIDALVAAAPGTPVDDPVFDNTFTLTTSADPVVGTTGDDLITGAAGTLNNGDLITDATSTDNDVLRVTLDEDNIAATISGIESIEIELDLFGGAGATLDAANITDATITFASSKLGFDGVAEAVNIGENVIAAGTGITQLNVTGAAADTATISVSGDTGLLVTTSTTADITATAASDVDYTTGANQVTETTVNGAVDIELSMVVADIIVGHTVTNALTAGSLTLNVTNAGAFDITNISVDTVNLEASVGGTVTIDETASFTTEVAQTSLVVSAAVATAATNSVNLTTGFDLLTATTFTNVEDANIEVTTSVTIDDLATANTATITGTGDVTVTTTVADELDASGLTGALTLTTTTASSAVSGGSGANDVTLGDFNSSYTGLDGGDTLNTVATTTTIAAVFGSGADTLELAGLTTGTVVAQMGSGDDIIDSVSGVIAAADITIDGGAGTDAINFTVDQTFAAATLDITNVEGMTLEAGVDITILAADISGDTYTITGDSVGVETFSITGLATTQTIDASNLTVSEIDTFTITGGAAVDTITGTATADVIVSGGGADVLTGGLGADSFVFAVDDSTETAMAAITDFAIATFDVLTNTSTVLVDVVATDVSGVTSEAGDVVTASTTDGIMTLAGADAANIDTLAEWIDAAEVILAVNAVKIDSLAFEFSGDTYVVDATAAGATQNIVELTGVTGLVAVGAAAAVDTLVIL